MPIPFILKQRQQALRLGAAALSAIALGGALFGSVGVADTANEAEPRMHRLTEAQYRATIADVFGSDIRIAGRFEPDMRVDGLLAAGTGAVALSPAGAEQYEQIARGIAEQVTDPEHRDRLVRCAPGPGDGDGGKCARSFFERIGTQLYRRPLSKAELQLSVDQSLAAAETLGDFHAGMAVTLAAMLSDLPFLFRIDKEVRDSASPTGWTLDSWSRASRLSYFLWNTTPDQELLSAARSGALMTESGLADQIRRMMLSPRFEAGARSFFDDFFQLEGMMSLPKDGVIYPAFRSSAGPAAREQTLRTMIALLVREDGDYRDIFTTRRVAMNRELSPLYRLAYAPHDWSIIELPRGNPRSGLLTQISFLALHSHEGRSSPTLRGKALKEILMCEHIPTPPASVNFTIVQDTSNPTMRTARERLKAHLDDEECAACHKLTDPMGLALENFDGAGQYRAIENGVLIDASGSLDDIAFVDSTGLGEALARNPAATQCLAQKAWSYAQGRPVAAADKAALARLNSGFSDSGYRLRALFSAIVMDPAFFAVGLLDSSHFAGTGEKGGDS